MTSREYLEGEKPFLDQLANPGREVRNLGAGISKELTVNSMRDFSKQRQQNGL